MNPFFHHPLFLSAILACFALLALGAAEVPGTPQRFLITQFGAIGDGRTLKTTAIQSAIDRGAQAGGGVVVVPEGTFMSGAIFLKPGVNLRVEKGGMLKGSNQLKDYLPAGVSATERGRPVSAFVNAQDLTGVELSGEGIIDGNGQR